MMDSGMGWVSLGLLAGIILGAYDFLTKIALKEKGVLEVVFWCSLLGGLMWLPFFIIPPAYQDALQAFHLSPQELTVAQQMAVLPKSILMVATWVLSYYSVKFLPLSISAGVRASGPLWTALGAMLFLSEVLSWTQWLGLAVAMASYYLFSLIGKKEGISFGRNVWVLCMLAATLMCLVRQIHSLDFASGFGGCAGVFGASARRVGFVVAALDFQRGGGIQPFAPELGDPRNSLCLCAG